MNFAEFWQYAPAIALGGVVGALTRWATFRAWGSERTVAALLSVNSVGSFSLGVFYGIAPELPFATTAALVAFTGGLTTFSTLVVEIATQARTRQWRRAATTTLAHFGGGALFAWLGATAVIMASGA